jgi:monoamine oxidase
MLASRDEPGASLGQSEKRLIVDERDVDVCVIGAGFAGLAAAHALVGEGYTVAVLEARPRVGGRVWDKTASDGTVVSVGGTWLGRRQDRMFDLVKKVGLTTYPQYRGDYDPEDPEDPLNPFDRAAESIFRYDGRNHRYKGLFVPVGVGGLADLGLAFAQLDELTKTIPLDAPWEAPNARELDAQSLGAWIDNEWNVSDPNARMMLHSSLGLLFSTELRNVSLLGSMVLARGGGKDAFQYYVNADNTETHLVDGGGTAEVANRLGEALGDSLRKSTPVRTIRQLEDSVEVEGDGVLVRARYAIVAAPPVLASRIAYEPALPDQYRKLMEQMPAGAIVRGIPVYDKPFWREKGLSGFSVAPQSKIPVTIDQCPKPSAKGETPARGVLSSYAIGTAALELMTMDPAERRAFWLGEIAERFEDARALDPIDFSETDWSAEEWSRGGMISHFPPGVLTSYGSVLHEPHGRIYFAGTERATEMHGLIEGAVRSGEQAAGDIMEALD